MGSTASPAGWWYDRSITFKFSLGVGLLVCLMVVGGCHRVFFPGGSPQGPQGRGNEHHHSTPCL